ncbi:NAD(+)/NADH kinase [Halogeometricum borinquense]|uniref:NAD kinase n=1 Tax=Halogeometricum borinquense TaxID=60847 RepID=A0A6C0UN01_9EURY|nr:NAD(+)/NADH kinase [Halogeometricum borinquense]QIB75751.1 NAD(+)/NADH kinase [Halogeometricum borinquense]QIQ75749.1 NAD(+)/NADH kinase [Halogeometricum borinquense]
MQVAIVAQRGNSRAAYLADDLRERLLNADVEVRVDAETAETLGVEGHPVETVETADLVVSIGGDGTFLFTARGAGGTPILGVNLGEVGFLNAVGPDDAVEAVMAEVERFRDGESLAVREVPRIAAEADGWTEHPAMNEVVVQGPRRGHGGGISLEVRVDGSLYSGGHADGVLVATPTGSTAYNLSERGPLVHPSVEGLVINEMAPDGGMPPLVVSPDAEVTITVTDAEEAVVVSDGRQRQYVTPPTEVTIATTDDPVRLAGPSSDFFEALGKLD